MGSAKQELADKHRAAVLPKLDAFARAAELADSESWMTYNWPKDSPRFDLRDGIGDSVMAMREDITGAVQPDLRFARLPFDPIRIARQMYDFVVDPSEFIDHKRPRVYAESLGQVARARYLLIVFSREYRRGRWDHLQSFIDGHVRGVGLLMDVETLELRGGFEYSASNSTHVRAKESMLHHALEDDLSRQFGDALIERVAGRFPDATPPVAFGY